MLGTMAINTGVTIWERRARADSVATCWKRMRDTRDRRARLGGGHSGTDRGAERFARRRRRRPWSVAGMVAWTAWGILREASLVLTDAATDVEPKALLAAIVSVPGAITAHNLRVRSSVDATGSRSTSRSIRSHRQAGA